jgi:oxygen-independent coproporphyrinogen-3 oxidase
VQTQSENATKMSGIYIHIPFCLKHCYYCDFYSETKLTLRSRLISNIVKEIYLRKDYLAEKKIDTIYFGGGTPSLLQKKDFELIFEAIYQTYSVDSEAEITFEANPDDLTKSYLSNLSSLPFNRISIGVQSFNDYFLKLLNRRHTGHQTFQSVKNAQEAGFENISIDLIYGLPNQTLSDWKHELDIATDINIQHISAYGLTYEDGTHLKKLLDLKKLTAVSDENMNEMYRMLLKKMQEDGFEAYEISNFALHGFRSQHNSAYWQQKPYIGIGPSAHSYNVRRRFYSVENIETYLAAFFFFSSTSVPLRQ